MNVYGSVLGGGGSGKIEYSTSEKAIGKWITGATLYQKTFSFTAPTVTVDGTYIGVAYATGLSTSYLVVSIDGFIINAAGGILPLNSYTIIDGNQRGSHCMVDAPRNIQLKLSNTVFSAGTAYVTLQYVK